MAAEIEETIRETLLEEARLWVRKSLKILDPEIVQTIAAGVMELEEAGVIYASSLLDDPLEKQALKEYLKANFGYEEEAPKHQARFEKIRDFMAGTKKYGSIGGDDDWNGQTL